MMTGEIQHPTDSTTIQTKTISAPQPAYDTPYESILGTSTTLAPLPPSTLRGK